MKKLLGISLVWILLAGSIATPLGIYSAFATGGQSPLSTSTVLSSNTASSIFGNSVTFTATVSPSTATGTVQFNDSNTIIGTGTISSGQATFSTTSLSIGSHTIIAKYLGDTNDVPSTSASLTQTVNPIVITTTTLVSSQNPSVISHSVTFTATVSPSTATGTVQFNDSNTILGASTISSGQATFTTQSLSLGSHNMIAKYLGDTDDAPSTGTLTQIVNPITARTTTTTLVSSQNPSIISHSVTFTATVSPSTATGTIQFNDSNTILGTSTISSGQATFTTQSLSIGSHNIIAKYLGDTNDAPSTSSLTQTVSQIPITTTTLASSQNPSTIGNSVTFTATISPSTATGTVQFNDSNTIIGTGTISSGHATFSTSSLSTGSHNIIAKYLGDTNDAQSTSSVLTQTVNQISLAATTTTLASSQNPSTIGNSVTFTATISPSTATGTVQFNDSNTIIGTGTISSGHATFSTPSLSAGSHNIIAKYLGDTNDAPSTSSLTQTVNQVTTTSSSVSLSSNATSVEFGHSVTFTATISPSTATGTVQLLLSGTNFGSPVTVSAGQAIFTTSSLPAGSFSLVALYSGDSNVSPSISSPIPISTVINIGGSGSGSGGAGGNDDDHHHDEKNTDNDNNNGKHNGEKNSDDEKNTDNDNNNGKHNGEKKSHGHGNHEQNNSNDNNGDD